MQALLDETQLELRELAHQIAEAIGIANPSDLAGRELGWTTLIESGLVELRDRADDAPTAGGVEVALIVEALAGKVAPAPYVASGVIAVDLIARSGDPQGWLEPVLSGESLTGLLLDTDLRGMTDGSTAGIVWGGQPGGHVLALRREGADAVLLRRAFEGATELKSAVSITQPLWELPAGEWEVGGSLDAESLARVEALALTCLAADTVGALRAALTGAVDYAKQRVAYGKLIGSFQALQHIVADDYVDIEGAAAAVNYAAWGVDELSADEALLAARTAKATAGAIARNVAEDIMQVYGGIGQTWEHIAHFYLRRVLLNTALFGDEDAQLDAIADARLGGE